jgi:hypothetical protein
VTRPYATGRRENWAWDDLLERLWWLYGLTEPDPYFEADLASWRALGRPKTDNHEDAGEADANSHVVKGNPPSRR